LSETEFGTGLGEGGFMPNLYINIEPFLDDKLEIMSIYKSEMGEPPFPRSIETIRAKATLRGSEAGFLAAESFVILKEII
jgi:hypothetical protein